MCGAAPAGGGGGGPTTLTPSAAQPVSSASAIALRMAPVDAPPVRFLIGVFLLTALANTKALGAHRRPFPVANGRPKRGSPFDSVSTVLRHSVFEGQLPCQRPRMPSSIAPESKGPFEGVHWVSILGEGFGRVRELRRGTADGGRTSQSHRVDRRGPVPPGSTSTRQRGRSPLHPPRLHPERPTEGASPETSDHGTASRCDTSHGAGVA